MLRMSFQEGNSFQKPLQQIQTRSYLSPNNCMYGIRKQSMFLRSSSCFWLKDLQIHSLQTREELTGNERTWASSIGCIKVQITPSGRKIWGIKEKEVRAYTTANPDETQWNISRSAALGSVQLVKQLSKDERLIRQWHSCILLLKNK